MCMLVVHTQFYQVLLRSVSRIQIKELIVTNSILLDDTRKPSNTKELSVVGLLAQAIIRVYERESVSVLFD